MPTPPAAPITSTLSPARSRASFTQAWNGVAIASEATAASMSDTPSGIATTLRSGSDTYSA